MAPTGNEERRCESRPERPGRRRPTRRALVLGLTGAAWAGGLGATALLGGQAAAAATTSSTSNSGTFPGPAPGPAPAGRPGGGVGWQGPLATSGTVIGVARSGGTFTVLTGKGKDVTVKVSSSTKYLDRGASAASLSDITDGEVVAVRGTTSSGVVSATSVGVMPPRPPRAPGGAAPGLSGAVLSVDGSAGTFSVLTPAGATKTVRVTASTTYRVPGTKSSSLSDLTRGERVLVERSSSSGSAASGTVTARAVFVQPAGRGAAGFGPRPAGPAGPGGPGGRLGGGPGGFGGGASPRSGQPPAGRHAPTSGSTTPKSA